MLKYRLHLAFAIIVTILAGISVPLFVLGYYKASFNPIVLAGTTVPEDLLKIISAIAMLAFAAVGTAKCNPLYALLGVSIAAIINYIGIPYTAHFTGFWWFVILSVASFVGAILSSIVYYNVAPAQATMSKEDHNEKNPKCKTCYAKSFCAWQPGAVLDQYKDKKVIPIQSIQEPLPEPVKAPAFVYKATPSPKIEHNFERLLTQIKRGIPYRWNNPWITQKELLDISSYDERIEEASDKAKSLLKEIKAELIAQGAMKNDTLVHSTISSAIYSAIYNNHDFDWDIDFKFKAIYSYVLWTLFITCVLSLHVPAMFGIGYVGIPMALLGSFGSLLFSNGQKQDIIGIMIAVPALVLMGVYFRM